MMKTGIKISIIFSNYFSIDLYRILACYLFLKSFVDILIASKCKIQNFINLRMYLNIYKK